MISDYVRCADALLDKLFFDDVVYLVWRIGYEIKADDEQLVAFIIDDSVQELLTKTHQAYLPAGLRFYLIKMIAGRFYLKKMATTGVPGDFNFDRAVSEVSEGGDRVVFADSSSIEDQFRAYMQSYAGGDSTWIHYRKLAW